MANKVFTQKNRVQGFTIVELLIVVVVVAILASITIIAYSGIRDRANDSSAKTALANATKKIETYRFDPTNTAQQYPSTLALAGMPAATGLIYNFVSGGNYYCLESRSGSAVYHQTSLKMTQVVGACPATSGLVAWWPLNNDAKNYVTGDTNAIVNNATPATGQNGLANGSYSFTGNVNSNINTNHISSRDAFSFSLWAYPTNISGYRAALSEARDCCGTLYRGFDFKTSYSTPGAASIGLWAGGSGTAVWASGATSTADAWNFFAGTYDGATLSLYKNGVLEGSSPYVGAPGTPINPLYIARSGVAVAGAFAGQIDDVRIYNRALSATEVLSLYTVGAQ